MRTWPDSGQAVSTAVRFAVMGEPGQVRAGHGAYIAAVRRSLEEGDVVVTSARIGDLGVRSAELHICPASGAFAAPVPAEAFMHWDEENGWSLGLRRDLAMGAVLNPVYKGLGVLPDPQDVASWAVVLLTHPEVTPSREDHPFRDSAIADHEFEAQLARYASGG
jgi:hypothetical protein